MYGRTGVKIVTVPCAHKCFVNKQLFPVITYENLAFSGVKTQYISRSKLLPSCAKIYILARRCPMVVELSVRKLFLAQIVLVLITAGVWGVVNSEAVPSVLYGGISCILPNLVFAFFFFSRKHGRRPGQILIAFYIGEFAKMFVSALIMILAIRHLHALVIPTVASFFIANMVFWMAPALVLKKQQMRTV